MKKRIQAFLCESGHSGFSPLFFSCCCLNLLEIYPDLTNLLNATPNPKAKNNNDRTQKQKFANPHIID